MARRSSSASIAATIFWLRMYSNRMSASEAEPRADLGQRPEEPGRGRGRLLGADREGDLGMVLVGGAGVEIGGRRQERQQHQQQRRRRAAPSAAAAPGRAGGHRRRRHRRSAPPRPAGALRGRARLARLRVRLGPAAAGAAAAAAALRAAVSSGAGAPARARRAAPGAGSAARARRRRSRRGCRRGFLAAGSSALVGRPAALGARAARRARLLDARLSSPRPQVYSWPREKANARKPARERPSAMTTGDPRRGVRGTGRTTAGFPAPSGRARRACSTCG